MRPLALTLYLALMAGCATHTHVGDCASCSGYVIVQDRASDDAQTQRIYAEVNRALGSKRAESADVAQVRSDS